MSKAGVFSSIGDEYQSLIASMWAIEMLSNSNIEKIEIDATSLTAQETSFFVDDIVVSFKNGNVICCQCKKNQPKFEDWQSPDLEDDLVKAWKQWNLASEYRIIFYSRHSFGILARIQERATRISPDCSAFLHDMPKDMQIEYAKLKKIFKTDDEHIYCFFKNIEFESIAEKSLRSLLVANLRPFITHPNEAFELIMRLIDSVARRSLKLNNDIRSNIIKKEFLLERLTEQGHRITPPINFDKLVKYFENISLRGRIWPRDIHSIRIKRKEIDVIIEKLTLSEDSILVEGQPGIGKTCVLLDLVEAIESRKDFFPIFLQSRDFNDDEFKHIVNELIDNIALISENIHTAVIIDSLDVLSISRDQSLLSDFLRFIYIISKLKNVTLIVSCRSFDIKYDSRLSSIKWNSKIEICDLDFETEVKYILTKCGLDLKDFTEAQKSILVNPQMLKMYISIALKGDKTPAQTSYELTERYLNSIILNDDDLGSAALTSLANTAQTMLSERCLEIPRARFQASSKVTTLLLSAGVFLETERGTLTFSHQTLLDSLAVTSAELSGATLLDFIRQHKPVPFIRPSIRTFFFQLRAHDPLAFRRQVRAVLGAEEVAFHLKRLVVTSLAEILPVDDDWPLFIFLFKEHASLFDYFFHATKSNAWLFFIYNKFIPFLQSEMNGVWCLRVAEKVTSAAYIFNDKIVDLWLGILNAQYCDTKQSTFSASRALSQLISWDSDKLRELFLILLRNLVGGERDFLGTPLSLWIDATNTNDDILWMYIVRSYNPKEKSNSSNELNCKSHYFYNKDFLPNRMSSSEILLSQAIASIQEWHALREDSFPFSRENFLWETSFQKYRSQQDLKTITPLAKLIRAVEQACITHATQDSEWWKNNAELLASSKVLGLQYIAIKGLSLHPAGYNSTILSLLKTIEHTNGYPFHNELAELFGKSAPYMTEEERIAVQNIILNIYPEITEERDSADFVLFKQADFFIELPAPYRLPEAQRAIDLATKYRGIHPRKPSAMTWGGIVHAPFSYKKFLESPDSFSTAIAQHYFEGKNDPHTRDYLENSLIGGTEEVARQFAEAVSRDPLRFLAFSRAEWNQLGLPFREAVLDGLGNHIRYRFGNLKPNGEWEPLSSPSDRELAEALLDIIGNRNISGMNEYSLVRALMACTDYSGPQEYVERICFWLIRHSYSQSPSIEKKTDEMTGYNSIRGIAATACARLAVRWCEKYKSTHMPDLLLALLYRFARDEHSSVRAMLLRELPLIIYHQKDLGWELFEQVVDNAPDWLWNIAYDCLYYNYHNDFPRIEGYLRRMSLMDLSIVGESFGDILALSFLSEKIEFENFKVVIGIAEPYQPWKGIFDIFTHNLKNPETRDKCISGLEYALSTAPKDNELSYVKESLFDDEGNFYTIPISLISLLFDFCLVATGDYHYGFYRLPKWLVKAARVDITYSLNVLEVLFKKMDPFVTDLTVSEDFAELLTLLFREAEENEEIDNGAMLDRVLAIQDYLLEKGVYKLEEWLTDAERP